MIDYQFLQAHNIEQALTYLADKKGVKLLAGGTDLIVDINKENERLSGFEYLLDISNIEELEFINQNRDCTEIGPLVTHTALMEDEIINENYPILVEAAATIGSTQIRNRGTIGGNVNNASPAADLLPPLLALGAEVELKSGDQKRVIELSDFLTGPYRTSIEENELMTAIRIPLLEDNYYSNFQKIGRRKALSIARLNLALVTRISDGVFRDPRIVPGAATPYPCRFSRTEEAVANTGIEEIDLEKVGERASEEMIQITGERWSTPYKKPTIATLVKRALKGVIKEVKDDAKN